MLEEIAAGIDVVSLIQLDPGQIDTAKLTF